MIRKLYDWVISWAEKPGGTWALFILAFCESSFFPIPPDVLLIALAVGAPLKSFRFAIVCDRLCGWRYFGICYWLAVYGYYWK